MTNLENILDEKDTKIKEIKNFISETLSKEQKKYNSKLEKLGKKYQDNVENIGKEEAIKVSNLENTYTSKITQALISDLNLDFNTLKTRGEYVTIPREKIEQALNLKKIMKKIRDNNQALIFMNSLTPEAKQLLEADTKGLEDLNKQKEITTYISSNGANCYILTPIRDDSTKLTKDLEDKLLSVINLGKISVGQGDKFICFKGEEIEYPQKFLMFKLETPDPKYLAKILKEKLNDKNIQPKSFTESNLINKVIEVDFAILKNFINYCPAEKTAETRKKRGRKSTKNIEATVGYTSQPSESHLKEKCPEYNQIKAQYDSLTEKYGHPLTRTELNFKGQRVKDFYNSLKEAEAQYGKFDFIPNLKSGPKSKKKE